MLAREAATTAKMTASLRAIAAWQPAPAASVVRKHTRKRWIGRLMSDLARKLPQVEGRRVPQTELAAVCG